MMNKTEALVESTRCLQCHDSPCQSACPANIHIPAFIRMIKSGNLAGAAEVIYRDNPLGGICGYVCPTEELCKKECTRRKVDMPVRIRELHQYATELYPLSSLSGLKKAQKAKGKKIAIIGSGPAGLACAMELASNGYDVTIFEAKPHPGGILRYGIPSHRLTIEFLERELEDIKRMGVKINCNSPVKNNGVDRLLSEGYSAVFIATGLGNPKRLNVPGAELKNVLTATEFLRAAKNEDTKDIARMVKGKNIAIIGGGSVAMDVAVTARRFGAKRVYAICLESLAELPAKKEDFALAVENFVTLKPHSQITEIIGRRGAVAGVRGCEVEWIRPNLFVPSNARPVPGTEFSLTVSAVIFAIGYAPDPQINKICSTIKYDKNGRILTGKDGVSTADKRVFAGGDIVRGAGGTVVEAVRDGKKAAEKIMKTVK
jgi:glutamate synthase (NADPH/NADH) small chain